MVEQIHGQPEAVLNNFDVTIEACQVVVSVTDHTPGVYGSRYSRLSVVLSQQSTGTGGEEVAAEESAS